MAKQSLIQRAALTAKGLVKIAASSRPLKFRPVRRDKPLIIMGNGPSLNQTIADSLPTLKSADTMAVNFAANAPEFKQLKPKYYVLADPHFFKNPADPNVSRLIANLSAVDWEMTLFLPYICKKFKALQSTNHLKLAYYNTVGVEGFRIFTDYAYRAGLAMPRPRNVLIPSIMLGIRLGYKEIYLVGADHSWTKTLSVDEDNHVVSIQPHFYKESESEQQRIRKDYLNVTIDDILYSFYVAFNAYRRIRQFADRHGIAIYNATPGSFIDAFERRPLPFS